MAVRSSGSLVLRLLLLGLLVAVLMIPAAAYGATTRYEEDSASVAYTGSWTPSPLAGHSGGNVVYTTSNTATATFSFSGTGVTYFASKWYNRGYAEVSLDGGAWQQFDLYAPGTVGDTNTVTYQAPVYSVSGLSNGPHTLAIRRISTRNPAALTPYLITIDAFDVTTPDPVVSTSASSPWSITLLVVIGVVGMAGAVSVRKRLVA